MFFFSQEEKTNVEKKLRALCSDVDDRDTTITLLTEELNDTRAAVEALEEELTEWRSKQVRFSFSFSYENNFQYSPTIYNFYPFT